MIQIHLEPEIEAQLVAEARARGLSPESYVEQIIAERTAKLHTEAGSVDRLASLEKFLEEMAAYSDKIPQLPDRAFTRESFYQDHN